MTGLKLSTVKGYMGKNKNILITGLAGTGKTTILREAASQLGYKMKYFESAHIDPFVHLIGIPTPNHEMKCAEFFRPHDIDEAEVIFFDEINRADPRTINALFEITQFHTINGEPLPNLKCVVAAINPDNGDYTVETLDKAFYDRFDVYLVADPVIDRPYFTRRFNAEVAAIADEWWTDHHNSYLRNIKNSKNKVEYISPRRMEKMIANFEDIPTVSTLEDSLPTEVMVNVSELAMKLNRAFKGEKLEDVTGVEKYMEMSATRFQNFNSEDLKALNEVLENASTDEVNAIARKVCQALSGDTVPTETLVKVWAPNFIKNTQTAVLNKMLNSWDPKKMNAFVDALSVSK